MKMKLDKNKIFILNVFIPTPAPQTEAFSFMAWCREYWGLSQVKFPHKDPFRSYWGIILLNSNPCMVLISSKGIRNKSEQKQEISMKIYHILSHYANFG